MKRICYNNSSKTREPLHKSSAAESLISHPQLYDDLFRVSLMDFFGGKAMKIQFIGAAHEVTGSCTLLEVGGRYYLVDCGME